MPGKAKQPAPKGQPADQAKLEMAQLKQQVLTLESKLAFLLKDLDARKQFFGGRKL